MLTGTVAGGIIAQVSTLGVPYLLRAAVLALTFLVAVAMMHDVGFTPRRGASVGKDMRGILSSSVRHGFRNTPVRWVMLAAPFSAGVGYYAFYAMQPYLLELYGESESYAIAGLAAAVVAAAQIVGGLVVPYVRHAFRRRTDLLLFAYVTGTAALACIGLTSTFWIALTSLTVWAVVDSVSFPIRQTFINGLIPSAERATLISADNLISSAGGVALQPALGKVADVWSYSASYLVGAAVSMLALPFVLLARREKAPSDAIDS
jgi:sugar phosphate permease